MWRLYSTRKTHFEKEIFDELENDTVLFCSKRNMTLGDFNARTSTLEDSVSKDGNIFINDFSKNCF